MGTAYYLAEQNIAEQRKFWDGLAKPCSHYERRSAYADEFLKLSDIHERESVFDMGCGTGTLCLPLSDAGHRVFCADFSEAMLKSLRNTVEEEKNTLLTLCSLSWQEDWTKRNAPICDLAFASRSMFGVDPMDAVTKLTEHARRRICITLPVNSGMFRKQGSPYSLGNADEVNAYAEACISEVRKLGYVPLIKQMAPGENKESRWLFVSWDK